MKEELIKPLLINLLLVVGALLLWLNTARTNNVSKVKSLEISSSSNTSTNETFVGPVRNVMGLLQQLSERQPNENSVSNPFYTTNYLPPPPVVEPPPEQKVEEPPPKPKPAFTELDVTYLGLLQSSSGRNSAYISIGGDVARYSTNEFLPHDLILKSLDKKLATLALGTNQVFNPPFNEPVKLKIPIPKP